MIILTQIGGETRAWSSFEGWTDTDQAEVFDNMDIDFLRNHFERNGRRIAVVDSMDQFLGWHATGMAMVK